MGGFDAKLSLLQDPPGPVLSRSGAGRHVGLPRRRSISRPPVGWPTRLSPCVAGQADRDGGQEVIDLDYVFKLRLVVARVGEMDLAQWWNTNGQLGSLRASVLRRGFPRTHRFAQARSVFAVAAHRCADLYQPSDAVTLWDLPASVEDDFEQRWETWIDDAASWEPFFKELEDCSSSLEQGLCRLALVREAHVQEGATLRGSAEQHRCARLRRIHGI